MTAKTSWLIGNAPDCDLVVDRPSVSWNHCRLSREEGGYLLEDLGSTNGTFVDGRRISAPTFVTRTDGVTLGLSVPMPWPEEPPFTLGGPERAPEKRVYRVGRDRDNDVVIDDPEVSGLHARVVIGPDPERGELEDMGSTNGSALNSPDNRVTHASFTSRDTLYFGPIAVPASRFFAGEAPLPLPFSVPVPPPADGIPLLRFVGTSLTIGRDPSCDLVVDAPVVSGRHARLLRSGDLIVLEDLRSSNGTYKDGRRIDEPTVVRHGDLIGLGLHTLRLVDAATAPGQSAFPVSLTEAFRAKPTAPVAKGRDAARIAAVAAFAVQPLIAAALVLIVIGQRPAGPSAGGLFGLGLGAVWLGLCASAVDRAIRGRDRLANGRGEIVPIAADLATGLAIAIGPLLLACVAMWLLVSARLDLGQGAGAKALLIGLTALAAFALGRILIGLARGVALAVPVGVGLMIVMAVVGSPRSPLPALPTAVRWASGALPSRWAFEGLLAAADDRSGLAEPYFPAETDRAGLIACVSALALMTIGFLYAAAIVEVAAGGRAGKVRAS